MKTVTILGSTGSIGTQTLEIIRAFPDQFRVHGLSCNRNISLLKKQIDEFKPAIVCIKNQDDATALEKAYPNITVVTGREGLIHTATQKETDLLVVAIVGTTSLEPTANAIENKIPIALACKEVLVSAGSIIMELAKKHAVPLLPIDSEHAALKQCLAGINEDPSQIETVILTASGGPFWTHDKETFDTITKDQALNHPNWDMGGKITIDSATLMNKGLEIIEAHHLFNIPYSKLSAVIHPDSIVHALVEFTDGTYLSQMGQPDMRFPIQYALTYPEKWPNTWPKTDLTTLNPLTFHPIDTKKFPLFQLALEMGEKGGSAPAILNAANEAAVMQFLDGKITFTDIIKHVENALTHFPFIKQPSLHDIITLDREVKEYTYGGHQQKRQHINT